MKSMIVFFAFAMLFVAAHAQLIAPAYHGAPILTTGLGWVNSAPLAAPLAAPAYGSSWITTDNAYALPATSILYKK